MKKANAPAVNSPTIPAVSTNPPFNFVRFNFTPWVALDPTRLESNFIESNGKWVVKTHDALPYAEDGRAPREESGRVGRHRPGRHRCPTNGGPDLSVR